MKRITTITAALMATAAILAQIMHSCPSADRIAAETLKTPMPAAASIQSRMPSQTPTLSLNGLTVDMTQSNKTAHIKAYSLLGLLIAEGIGTVTLPGSGIWLVSCNNKTWKITIGR